MLPPLSRHHPNSMKFSLIPLSALVCTAALHAQTAPKFLGELLKAETPVKAEIVVPAMPAELDKYVAKVKQAALKNREWFEEYSKNNKSGVPLPYDERLGLTKEEYDDYQKIWAKRELRAVEAMIMTLKGDKEGRWMFLTNSPQGKSMPSVLATLKYDPKDDTFRSPNGTLTRIADVNADANSTLGAWTGQEWRYLEETSLATTKENVALGKTADGKYGLLIYSFQEVSPQGSELGERRQFVIRFGIGASAALVPAPPATPAGDTKPKPANTDTKPKPTTGTPTKPKKK